MPGLAHLDRMVAERAGRHRDTSAMRAIGAASEIADQAQLFSVCAATVAVGLALRRPHLAGTGVRMAAAMIAATLLKDAVKDRVDRTRPYVVLDGGRYTFQRGDHDVTELDAFPSGHTAGAVAVARVIARRHPSHARAAAAGAAAIALVQVPRAKHYPSDLLAGAMVGLAADALVSLGERLVRRLS